MSIGGQKTDGNALDRLTIMLSPNRLNGKRRGKKIVVNLVLTNNRGYALKKQQLGQYW